MFSLTELNAARAAMAHRTCHVTGPRIAHCALRITEYCVRCLTSDRGVGMSKRSKHTWVINVIEDGSASIQIDGRMVTPVPAWMLPESAREGDVLSVSHTRKEDRSALVIEIDPDARTARTAN